MEGRCGVDKLAFFNKKPTIETALNFYTKGSFTSNGRNPLKRPRDHRFCLNSWKEARGSYKDDRTSNRVEVFSIDFRL